MVSRACDFKEEDEEEAEGDVGGGDDKRRNWTTLETLGPLIGQDTLKRTQTALC